LRMRSAPSVHVMWLSCGSERRCSLAVPDCGLPAGSGSPAISLLVEAVAGVERVDRERALDDDLTRVDPGVEVVDGDPCTGVALRNRPDQRRDAPVAWQQRWVEVERGAVDRTEQPVVEDLRVTDREEQRGPELLDLGEHVVASDGDRLEHPHAELAGGGRERRLPAVTHPLPRRGDAEDRLARARPGQRRQDLASRLPVAGHEHAAERPGPPEVTHADQYRDRPPPGLGWRSRYSVAADARLAIIEPNTTPWNGLIVHQ